MYVYTGGGMLSPMTQRTSHLVREDGEMPDRTEILPVTAVELVAAGTQYLRHRCIGQIF